MPNTPAAGSRALEALLAQTLADPRIDAATRREIERVFARGVLAPSELTVFCAQAIVLARAAQADATMRGTFGWLLHLADLARGDAPKDPPATPNAATARAHFSPGNDCLDAICNEFRRAKAKADVCVFTITDDRIRSAMLDARRRGVTIRVVSDNDKAMDEGSDIEPLRRAGIEVRVDDTEAHMHHKFTVFDGATLVTGSYNWTRSAANANQENIVVTADRALVDAFEAQFEKLWRQFAPASRSSDR